MHNHKYIRFLPGIKFYTEEVGKFSVYNWQANVNYIWNCCEIYFNWFLIRPICLADIKEWLSVLCDYYSKLEIFF
jgi:hypothetical protein